MSLRKTSALASDSHWVWSLRLALFSFSKNSAVSHDIAVTSSPMARQKVLINLYLDSISLGFFGLESDIKTKSGRSHHRISSLPMGVAHLRINVFDLADRED